MSTQSQGLTDLQAAVTGLQTANTALVAEDASILAAVKALQAQVAAGSPVTNDQLEAIATQVNAASAQVTGVTNDLTAAIAPPLVVNASSSNVGTTAPISIPEAKKA